MGELDPLRGSAVLARRSAPDPLDGMMSVRGFRLAWLLVLVAHVGCASAEVRSSARSVQELAISALVQRAAREAPADSAVIAVCVKGRRVNSSALQSLKPHTSTPLVSCDRSYDSRDGSYFDRATGKSLWAVDLESVQLNGQAASADGSVHCGITCGGRHQISLAQANGVWSVVEIRELTVF